jgi:flavodoxin
MKDILVAYYSRTGKTRLVAEELALLLEADLEEIQEKKDRSGMMGYLSGGRDATLNRPAELSSRHTADPRRIVVLGMPVWAWGPPPAMRAYLAAYPPPAGSRICAFCTHDGGGGQRTFRVLSKLLGRELAATFEWKKPAPADPVLRAALKDWAAKAKAP